jgi:hypothetical protein
VSASQTESVYTRDASKPWEGEACNEDYTLKDASEIVWVHSPSQTAVVLSGGFDSEGAGDEGSGNGVDERPDEVEEREKTKRKVSI